MFLKFHSLFCSIWKCTHFYQHVLVCQTTSKCVPSLVQSHPHLPFPFIQQCPTSSFQLSHNTVISNQTSLQPFDVPHKEREKAKKKKKSGTPTKSNWENCNLNNFTPSAPPLPSSVVASSWTTVPHSAFSHYFTLEALKIHYDYSLFFHLPCVSFHHYSILRKKRGLEL